MRRHLKGWKNASAQFQKELLASADGVNRAAQQVFIDANNRFMDYVQDNKELLPYYTANLHDSIVSVVSQSGRVLRAVYMPKEATRPQNAPDRKRIVGMEEAIRAVRRADYPRTGVASTLIVAVPYAEGANATSKRRGYLNWLQNAFESEMRTSVEVLKYVKSHPGAKPVAAANRRFTK